MQCQFTFNKIVMKTAIVIGSGFSGLSTAALLAKSGIQVTIVEKNKQLGGRARILKKNGFYFDMGLVGIGCQISLIIYLQTLI